MSETRIGRVCVTGPDSDGDYEIQMRDQNNDVIVDYTFLNREQANEVIVALGGTPPEAKS